MSEIETHIAAFKMILNTLQKVADDAPSMIAVRTAIEDVLHVWVDEVCASSNRASILGLAASNLNDPQLQSAIRRSGNPVYARILDEIGDNLNLLKLHALRIRRLSNADIDALVARGFDYDGTRHHSPAAEWLVRGAVYGKKKFRKKHPRKNPVVAHWEEHGLALPREGLSHDGAKLVADLIRNSDTLPRTVLRAAERSANSTDWRIALCLRIEGHSYPYTISQILNLIYGSAERHAAIKKCLAPASSNHEKLLRDARMAQVPSLEHILMLPREKESIDPILQEMGCALQESENAG